MVPLATLLADLTRALSDAEQATAVRRTIVEQYPDTEAGAEAAYKLGLEALFLGRSLEQAESYFRSATKSKSAVWGPPARVSLGIVLARMGKAQQAAFELRKVIGAKPATILGAQAAAMLASVMAEQKQPKEVDKARQQAQDILKQLIEKGPDQALAHYLMGLEKKHEGNRVLARQHLEAALAAGLVGEEAERARVLLGQL